MSFRLRNKKYLLTWPRSENLDMDLLAAHLFAIEDHEYAVICRERHADEGLHHHAVIVYKNALNSRRNLFNYSDYVCNVKAIGNRSQDLINAIRYVKKDGEFQEYGTEPLDGKRLSNLEKINYIKEHSFEECLYSGYFTLSQLRHVEFAKSKLVDRREVRERVIKWYWGPTGTGKTHTATEEALQNYDWNEIWFASGNNREFKNGYTGQRCVIFDDFRNGDVKFNELLVLCDKYPCNVNVKGSVVAWKADVIYFTSPDQPSDTFTLRDRYTGDVNPREDIGQFLRRLDETRYFPNAYIP